MKDETLENYLKTIYQIQQKKGCVYACNVAEEVIQRYEFFRMLLLQLGIPAQTAERDACRLKHADCPESFGALKACFYLISEVNQ